MKTYVEFIESIITKEGELIVLGGEPSGIIIFEDETPIGFQSCDNSTFVYIEDVAKVKEVNQEEFFLIEDYLKSAEFGGLHKPYTE